MTPKPSPPQIGLLPLMLFWMVVLGLLYVLMSYAIQPKQAQVLANGDLVMQRARDGHFYAPGTVNGQEVVFLVDTGASMVAVTDELAQKAMLPPGTPMTFNTANGTMQGRRVEGVRLTVGPVVVTNATVGVGLRGMEADQALLGQSFLSKFDVLINKESLTLRPR